jgi:hypothetical protein
MNLELQRLIVVLGILYNLCVRIEDEPAHFVFLVLDGLISPTRTCSGVQFVCCSERWSRTSGFFIRSRIRIGQYRGSLKDSELGAIYHSYHASNT